MKDNREIENIFSDKLKELEVDVNPKLWNNISSQIGSSTLSVSGGVSLFSKGIITIITSIVIGGAIYIGTSDINPKEKKTANLKVNKNVPTKKNTETNKVEEKQVLSNIKVIEENNTATTSVTSFVEENKSTNQPIQENIPETVEEIISIPVLPLIEEEPLSVTGPVSVIESLEKQEETVEIPEQVVGYKISKMPDVFSPNNDGVNDYFFVLSEGLTDYNLVVLNSRNETVFQSQNPDFKWDGNGLNGEPVEEGKYVYFLIAKDRNNNTVNKHSLLTVVR